MPKVDLALVVKRVAHQLTEFRLMVLQPVEIVQAQIDDVFILAPLVLDNHRTASLVDPQGVDAPAVTLARRVFRGEEVDAGQRAQVRLEEILQVTFVGEGLLESSCTSP